MAHRPRRSTLHPGFGSSDDFTRDRARPTSWQAISPYAPCPLCNHGEASSQHLCLWCPAVGMAWEHLRGAEATTMIHDVGRDPTAAGAAAALARQ
eukprot:2217561-Heterocapsa_arctica.AAC.1